MFCELPPVREPVFVPDVLPPVLLVPLLPPIPPDEPERPDVPVEPRFNDSSSPIPSMSESDPEPGRELPDDPLEPAREPPLPEVELDPP